MRCEESPTRTAALTGKQAPYKRITWYRKRGNYFAPICDWGYQDVWKAISENGWEYCTLYDRLYQQGGSPRYMRLSSFTQEEAVKGLDLLQEIEPETWAKLQQRVRGTNASKHLKLSILVPKTLPPAFVSLLEYRDYLLDKLIVNHKRTS